MRSSLVLVWFSLVLPSLTSAQDSSAAAQAMQRAVRLIEVGRPNEGLVQARRAIELAPQSAIGYSNLGAVYWRIGDLAAAVLALRKAIELDPRYRPAYSNLGNTYIDAGQLDSAIAVHRRAITLDSTRARAYIDLGTALEKNGHLDESIQQFQKAVTLDSNSALAWYNLGVSYYRLKRWPDALNAFITANERDEFYPHLFETLQVVSTEGRGDFERGASDHPEDPMSHYYLAYAFSYQRDWGRAMKAINRASQLARAPEFARARAWFESRRGRDEAAIVAARACAPADWSCYIVLGYSLGRLRRAREALDALLKAASINPNVINVQQTLGVAFMMVGDNTNAAAAFEQALALGSRQSLVHLNLVFAYRDLGKYDLAWRHARILERMGHPDAQVVIQELSRRSPEPNW